MSQHRIGQCQGINSGSLGPSNDKVVTVPRTTGSPPSVRTLNCTQKHREYRKSIIVVAFRYEKVSLSWRIVYTTPHRELSKECGGKRRDKLKVPESLFV